MCPEQQLNRSEMSQTHTLLCFLLLLFHQQQKSGEYNYSKRYAIAQCTTFFMNVLFAFVLIEHRFYSLDQVWVLRVPTPKNDNIQKQTHPAFWLCCDRIISSSTSFPRKRCFAGFGAIIWLFQSMCGTAYPTHKHTVCVCLLCFVFIWALLNGCDPFTKILSIAPHALGHYYD